MKKLITTTIALIPAVILAMGICGAPAAAQGPDAGIQHRMNKPRPIQKLDLTAEQQAAIRAIREKYRPQFEEIKNSNLTPTEKRQKMQALRTAQQQEIEAVLTPEQREKFKNWEEKHPFWNRPDCYRVAGVTPEQIKQLDAIHLKYRPQLQELRQSNLTPQEKQAKLREILKARDAEEQTVLTDAQKAKLKECRQKRMSERPKPAMDGAGAKANKANRPARASKGTL